MVSPPYSTSSPSNVDSPFIQEQSKLIPNTGHANHGRAQTRAPKASQLRVRSSHRKVRTGCLRCRQRRIKCDETQPSCLRCLRINQACPGSQQPVTRIFGLTTFEGFKTDFEKLCFDSFFATGSSRLALFQPSTKSFWLTTLPQLCQVYLPLRHGAIALAYVHEPFHNPRLGPVARSRATVDTLGIVMTHFNESLRGFVDDMDRLSVEAKVSCCIIYTALTIFLYRVGGVSSHVSAALNFLRQHEDAGGLAGPTLRQVLAPCIRRLLIDACTFSGAMATFQQGGYNPFEEHMYEILRIPPTFDTFEDAYEILANMLKYAIALSIGYLEHDSRAAVCLQASLQQFEIVFSKSRIETYGGKQLSSESIDFQRKDSLLHYHTTQLISFVKPDSTEDSYWAYIPEFRSIVEQMTVLIAIEPEEPWRSTLGWLPPLFLVATKCRVSTLRREALRMLHDLSRVERGWTSCVAYSLAKFVIDHETSSSSQDSVATTHIEYLRLLSVKFDHDGQHANITYLLQRDQLNLGIFSARLAMKVVSKTLAGAPAINLPDPVLQAFGYTGTIMLSPRADCHCHDKDKPVKYTGKVVKPGPEELVVWEAGLARSKPVQLKDSQWFQTIAGTRTENEEDKDKVSESYRPSGTVHHGFGSDLNPEHSVLQVIQHRFPLPKK